MSAAPPPARALNIRSGKHLSQLVNELLANSPEPEATYVPANNIRGLVSCKALRVSQVHRFSHHRCGLMKAVALLEDA